MKTAAALALLAAAAPVSQAFAASTGPIDAFIASTIRPDGPRQFQGSLSQLFFNVEGANNGQFANYGVLRFDLGGLDLSGATINSVTLDLFESNASFTFDGNVAAYFSDQDNVDIASAGTDNVAYVANGSEPFANDFTDAVFVGGDQFVESGDGDPEGMNFVQNLQSFADDDSIITLVLAEFNDPDVAATYGGIGNSNGVPALTIDYSTTAVPVPAAVWLFGSGLLALGTSALRRNKS